ncbi:MAG: alkaline phosphatase family protein [Anaerolineales bacterium]|nr:alkaline phosphatase family protein [Anaerolineales bacterium]
MRRRLVPIFGLILLLQSCAPAPNLWGDRVASTAEIPTILLPSQTVVPATALPSPTLTEPAPPVQATIPPATATLINLTPAEKIKHVIIITFDGMRADAVEKAPMPNLMQMMRDGAYTLKARTINYAVTLPAHASMISGLCQSKHGVDWDVVTYYKGYSKGVDIFDEAHAAGLKTVMVVNKEKMRQLAEPETTDVFSIVYGVETTIMKAAIHEAENGADLMFVHFGSPDARGHKYGWMSDSYLKALRNGDEALGLLLEALKKDNLQDSTLIIVTADHGGHDRGHVGTVIQDLEIPWVAYGAGVTPGEITNPVSIMDTAPTVAYALELPSQDEWDGLPVYQAFGLFPEEIHGPRICK